MSSLALHCKFQEQPVSVHVLTASALMCAKDGTLKSPWMSSGGALTPSHRNRLRPLASRKTPPSERRSSEQRRAAGTTSLFRSRLCCEAKIKQVVDWVPKARGSRKITTERVGTLHWFLSRAEELDIKTLRAGLTCTH